MDMRLKDLFIDSRYAEALRILPYYLLKKTPAPIVIVECGFLSNPQEAQLLADPVYQERTAWKIHMGILQYLHCNDDG